MNENFYDRVTQKLENRLTRAMGRIDMNFKNTMPYDTPKVPEREQLFHYMNMSPEIRQHFMSQDPEGYNVYARKMESLRNKYEVKGYA